MEEIVAWEGRATAATCTGCSIVEGSWRCLDCLGRQIYCTMCFCARHHCHPFHRVEHWTGSFFKAAWLCQTGLEMHLGHGGFECPSVGMVDVSRYHTRSDNGDVLAQDEFDSADIGLDNDGSDSGSSCEDDDTCIMGDGRHLTGINWKGRHQTCFHHLSQYIVASCRICKDSPLQPESLSGDDAMSKDLAADEISHMAWLHL